MAKDSPRLTVEQKRLLILAMEIADESGVRSIDALVSELASRVLQIEMKLRDYLRQVLAHPRFQRLEATYRNLRRLVDVTYHENAHASQETPKTRRTNLFVLDVSADDLRSDLRASSLRQCDLYEKLYFKRFDLLIGRPTEQSENQTQIFPFSLMLVDFELSNGPADDESTIDLPTIERLAVIGEACFCMMMLGASPQLFDLKSFSKFPEVENVANIFDRKAYRDWNEFRAKSHARMVAVTLPRVLIRKPYSRHFMREHGFYFDERPRDNPDSLLWGSSIFAIAQVFIRSFIMYDWFSDVCGIERDSIDIPEKHAAQNERHFGGVIDCLPRSSFQTDSIGVADFPSVECVISEFDEATLSALGFIGVYSCMRTKLAAILTCQSVQSTKRMTAKSATNNIRLSTMFNYMLCACRMAHRMKLECRNQIGQMKSVSDLQSDLQNWIIRFSSQRTSNITQKKEKPFCSPGTSVQVSEDDMDPGKYDCQVSLCPHHKFDSSKSRLVLEPITLQMNIRSDT